MTWASRVNNQYSYSANNWLVSLVNTQENQACCDLHGHSEIVVEGRLAGNDFVGTYDIVAGPRAFANNFQKLVGNAEGVIAEVRQSGFRGHRNYAQLSSTSWSCSPNDVQNMIASILAQRADRENLRQALVQAQRDHDVQAEAAVNAQLQARFKFQNAGSGRMWLLGGNGGENCTTWAEKQLAIARAGNSGKILDSIKASPRVHTIRTSTIITGGVLSLVAVVAAFAFRRAR